MSRTPTTPADIAEHLTGGDNDFAEDLEGWPCLSAEGNVLSIKLVLADKESTAEHFEAHVFAVEEPPPVAAGPVELDVKVARDLAELGVGRSIDGWTVVDDEEGEARRWVVGHTLIIRNEAGEHFAGYYDVGLTEVQETEPWERVAKFVPVERRVSVVRSVGWVTPSAKPAADVPGGGS